MHGYVAEPTDTLRALCGDLNAPRKEHPDGRVWTFARYRLDHLIASEEIVVRSCEYEHGWRERGLSDHAALIADLVVPAP
jgi:endonuclease/exonuclease/phosphatase family metal-dependent hydrolase